MSVISTANVTAVPPPTRAVVEKPVVAPVSVPAASINAGANNDAKAPQPVLYHGGIDGMNATNLILALQANAVSGYSAQAIETGGTPPPSIIDAKA